MGEERRRRDDEAGRRTARRFGLPEADVEEPDPVADLRHRERTEHTVAFPRAPHKAHRVEPPPGLGREEWERYPLERDRAPDTGEVPLDTDVALGLDEDVHKDRRGRERERGKRRDRGGEGDHGTA